MITHNPLAGILLGVNIDHVGTLRQVRRASFPKPVEAALLAESAGADAITVHLREDRRHIQDADVTAIHQAIRIRLNLEMAVTEEMLSIAKSMRPADCCLVPEKREELTTEGGLDVVKNQTAINRFCTELQAVGTRVSLFIDPDKTQISAASECGAKVIEIHTGKYANDSNTRAALAKVADAAEFADSLGLTVNAGHGLNYDNVRAIAAIPQIKELNIGHALVARAVMTGMASAVAEMKKIMLQARGIKE